MSSLLILSADELEILEFLKTLNGKFVSMLEICRRAGGRKKYKEAPSWAQPLLSRLVEAKIIQVNERGHYRIPSESKPAAKKPAKHLSPYSRKGHQGNAKPMVIGDNFFPSAETSSKGEDTSFWVSPEMLTKLKEEKAKREQQGKKVEG